MDTWTLNIWLTAVHPPTRLISASVGTVVYYGFQGHEIIRNTYLAVCLVMGVLGSVFPFMRWFNDLKYRVRSPDRLSYDLAQPFPAELSHPFLPRSRIQLSRTARPPCISLLYFADACLHTCVFSPARLDTSLTISLSTRSRHALASRIYRRSRLLRDALPRVCPCAPRRDALARLAWWGLARHLARLHRRRHQPAPARHGEHEGRRGGRVTFRRCVLRFSFFVFARWEDWLQSGYT